ncbi:hypothetical protein SLEP1_g7010 [Rubroshorea leprosula]|uniref:Late embryogenesis abundant protein LEA-2 subgroup domain-containing protein n=1 Tax=Rubroshorea leprosula TaxID=152421 RepID=A0AAV5I1M1_9ROSI|nr:hypothetical protein SLEP1_g7010 [Rubroshorea leprosula]
MSSRPQTNPQQQQQRPFNLVRCTAIVLLTTIVLVGLAVLIAWLVIRPKHLLFSIENGSVSNFNQSDTHMNSTFYFTIRAHNPNRRLSIYYDSIKTSVAYEDQPIAYSTIQPFFQPHRNVTRIQTKIVASNVPLTPGSARDIRLEKGTGEIELYVYVWARIRFKVGVLKSNERRLKLACSPVMVHFSPTQHFERTICEAGI